MLRIKDICFLIILPISLSFNCVAQNDPIIKYYDSSWIETSKDSAFYFTEFVKEDTFYRCTSYWMKSNKLNCKSSYTDTLFSKGIGLLLRYYENGQLSDSSFFGVNGLFQNTYHYYPDGKLYIHSYNNEENKKITEAFDENGKRLDNFIYEIDAEFPGGQSEWTNFIQKNLKGKVPVKKGAPVGTYQVIVRFIISKDGAISNIKPETNFGYGMEEEVIRVIKKSPKWNPATVLGKAVNAYRRQPITFIVSEK